MRAGRSQESRIRLLLEPVRLREEVSKRKEASTWPLGTKFVTFSPPHHPLPPAKVLRLIKMETKKAY
jgi:hypothetical protein